MANSRLQKLSPALLIASLFGTPPTVVAQTTTSDEAAKIAADIDALQKRKALIDAQKGVLDSEKALVEASKAADTQLEDLKRRKALADAIKDTANSEAEASKAKYLGTVTEGPYKGAVSVTGDKVGLAEAALLASRAAQEAAAIIASNVADKSTKFYVFASKDFPGFQRLLTFRFRKELLKQAFADAGVQEKPNARPEFVLTPGMISAGLDAFSKILGFFKTDYTVAGVDVKLEETVVLYSVAGALGAKSGAGAKKLEVYLPLTYQPGSSQSSVTALVKELTELVKLRGIASATIEALAAETAKREQAIKTATPADKDRLTSMNAEDKAKIERLKGVVSMYDSFTGALTTPDATGAIPLAALVQEFTIDAALNADDGAVLLLKLESQGGGYLIKKNFLTGLGSMPLYHMGGATVSYLLLNGKNGQVLSANAVPVHGGFVKAGQVKGVLRHPVTAPDAPK